VPSPDAAGTTQDANNFYSQVSYKLAGTVATGDVFTIGLRYKNYTVTVGSGGVGASLVSVAQALGQRILADSRYTAINPLTGDPFAAVFVSGSGSDVFLTITDTRGFNLQGVDLANPQFPLPGLTQEIDAFTGTIRLTTAAYQQDGSTLIVFDDATLDIEGTVKAGDVWTVTRLIGASTVVRTYTVADGDDAADVADGLQAAIQSGAGTAGGATACCAGAEAGEARRTASSRSATVSARCSVSSGSRIAKACSMRSSTSVRDRLSRPRSLSSRLPSDTSGVPGAPACSSRSVESTSATSVAASFTRGAPVRRVTDRARCKPSIPCAPCCGLPRRDGPAHALASDSRR